MKGKMGMRLSIIRERRKDREREWMGSMRSGGAMVLYLGVNNDESGIIFDAHGFEVVWKKSR